MKSILSLLIVVIMYGQCFAVEPVPQNVKEVVGFKITSTTYRCDNYEWSDGSCRTIEEPSDWYGENLFKKEWVLTYGEQENCTVNIVNDVIYMTKKKDGWPPCGVMQTFKAAVGDKFRIVADVVSNTDQSEIYTGFDGSIFAPGTGTRTEVLTSKYSDMTVWLQTYSKTIMPVTTVWKNVVIKRIE